ncbi:MAG: hypothetical protein ACI8RZ_004099 [Myxococcota bacterium]|jgi:hypothetical protein
MGVWMISALLGVALAADSPENVGDLTISEFMAEPQEVPNYTGEWFELYNASGKELDLNGLVVRGDTDPGFTVASSVLVPAGGYAVLGVGDCDDYVACSANEYNGGIAVDYVYDRTDLELNEDGDTIRIVFNSINIDQVTWGSTWSIQNDYALQANTNAFDLEWANGLSQNWCSSDSRYGEEALYGTPGAANQPCDDSNSDDDEDGFSEANGDCDDSDPYVHPGAYDGSTHDDGTGSYADGEGCCGNPDDDADCDGTRDDGDLDRDGDGYSEIDGDCDDTDGERHPGAVEEDGYTGVDDDCNDCIDDFDDDDDGYTECPEWSSPFDTSPNQADCDDDDDSAFPTASETPYDAVDNDCDGFDQCDVDEDGYLALPENVCPGLDADGNGILDCCAEEDFDGHPDGDKIEGDCDDNNAVVNPGGTEGSVETGGQADGVDNDCNGTTDDPYQDLDQDGWAGSDGDCNDDPDDPDAIFIYPGAEELCDDFIDNDCDGLFNDGCENRGRYASLQGGSLCGLSPRGSNKSALLLLLTLLTVVVRARGERSC